MTSFLEYLASSTLTILSVLLSLSLVGIAVDRFPARWQFRRRAFLTVSKPPSTITSVDCPYVYIRGMYGKHHFSRFVDKLSPDLAEKDPEKYTFILETMDVMHLCPILVDDISDDSDYRKGSFTAHNIYGRSETANRAYFTVAKAINRTVKEQPELTSWLSQNLEEVLEGQDLSLVWRRDGIDSFPMDPEERKLAYRKMASLKTGALFRMLGQLVRENTSADDLMTKMGWYSQLQNDCKNVFSTEYAKSKGGFAEDLRNGELSYPIVLALNQPEGRRVAEALRSGTRRNIREALRVIHSDAVKKACLAELSRVQESLKDWADVWGRKERMDVKATAIGVK